VLFREISPLLFDVEARKGILEEFGKYMNGKGITAVAGIDARGFLLAGLLAERFQLPLVMIRKEGKLPDEVTLKASYKLEYGEATLTIRKDILRPDDIVLVVDDVLATGGTL
jgi:adenine phosphoribosyltransferase